ncbi:MAG: STAS domain-containing protein [Bryobacteraceae bacterium]
MKIAGVQVSHREVAPDTVVVTLAGKMMLSDSAALETVIVNLLEAGRRKFIVDLSGLTHIDSTGIGTFIASLGKVSQAGGALAMAGAGGMVREGFRVTRLDKVFRFFPDVESARAAL